MLISILTVVLLMTTVSIVILVLLQQGKGADMGAAFGGGGSSQSLFGSRGSANFLSRVTAALTVIFFATSLSLAYLHTQTGQSSISVISQEENAVEWWRPSGCSSCYPRGAGDRVRSTERSRRFREISKNHRFLMPYVLLTVKMFLPKWWNW